MAKAATKKTQTTKKQATKKPAVNYNTRGLLIITAAVCGLTLLLITGLVYEDVLF